MPIKATAEVLNYVREHGYGIEVLFRGRERVQWWKPDGTAVMGLLPCDPYHVVLYRSKGWSLTPPPPVAPPIPLVLDEAGRVVGDADLAPYRPGWERQTPGPKKGETFEDFMQRMAKGEDKP